MQFILLPQLNKHVDCLFAVYHVTSVTVHNDVGYKHLDLLTYTELTFLCITVDTSDSIINVENSTIIIAVDASKQPAQVDRTNCYAMTDGLLIVVNIYSIDRGSTGSRGSLSGGSSNAF